MAIPARKLSSFEGLERREAPCPVRTSTATSSARKVVIRRVGWTGECVGR